MFILTAKPGNSEAQKLRTSRIVVYLVMASVFRLRAPQKMGQIPKGFEMTIYTDCNYVDKDSVAGALKRAGFTDDESLSWCSSGNWDCQQIE